MNLRSLDLNLLTVFDAVIVEQNISRAAQKIGMSQPAMSAAIARLRLTLNDELFIRTGHGVKPTPRALELEKPIRHILGLIENTFSHAKSFDFRASSRALTLASMDYAGMLIAPAVVKHLQQLQSKLALNLSSSQDDQLLEKMRSGHIDFTIDYAPIVADDYHSSVITTDIPCCLVNKNHSTIGDSLSLEDFLNTKQIVLAPYKQRVSALDEYLKSLDLSRQRSMVVPSLLNYPPIIANSDYICTLPKQIAAVFAKQFDLNIFPLPIAEFNINYYLMWHNAHDQDPAHRWMRETLLSLASDL